MSVQQLATLQPFFGLPRGQEEALDLSTWKPLLKVEEVQSTSLSTTLDPVFICIDIEAYERDQSIITEIGVATLDTRDVRHIHPSTGAESWLSKIRSMHVIIDEHKQYINTRYVKGCPDKFHFGTSRYLTLSDTQALLQRAIQVPDILSNDNAEEQRKVMLVAHSLRGDRKYMTAIGVDLSAAKNIIMDVDTQRLCSSKKQPARLSRLLDQLEIKYNDLHNAGNDAAYTMQALVKMVFLDAFDPVRMQDIQSMLKNKPVRLHRYQINKKARKEALEKKVAGKVGSATEAQGLV
ncbi:hypothetical protein K461DRAFT_296878 [Myriangium duriaei CBS 260.36]|uniref:Gfd2/YDR514C-like C-terminal domain-containing protein n=1 Tax=Myriangium duriaei CBS 260.36 TaxID=1168546 RepID=A0A9P4ISW8_9PEZI|nr:hypothetical protein K461DRAFT_296878 [Myriangium duriaei CBS 260.36]